MKEYTAIVRRTGEWRIGRIEEVLGVNCQKRSREGFAWEEDLGEEVSEGREIALGFAFDFRGRTRRSFYVGRHGALTFGARLSDRYDHAQN